MDEWKEIFNSLMWIVLMVIVAWVVVLLEEA